jgi:ABC-type phosphate/phosphonate transport system substrate-binding protein
MRWQKQGLVFVAWASLVASGSVAWAAEKQDEPGEPVQIGMVSSLFRDIPEPLIIAMMQPFGALMESQTGVVGRMVPGGDALHLGQLLAEDKVQLAVLHGFEFGWARQKYPELRPLMIAVNQQRYLRTLVIVRADTPLHDFQDLRGKAVAFPRRSREHCQLFFERSCQERGHEPKRYFARIATPASAEEALDDVVDKAIPAAVIDGVAFECYARRKPGRWAQLKQLTRSEVFPAAVVAYHPGALSEDILRRFREGMIQANQSTLGSQLMTLWKLTAFEPVPADFDQLVADIIRVYPAPSASR